jgi:hypothetical protein
MNPQTKPLNVPLIGFTLCVVIAGRTSRHWVDPSYPGMALAVVTVALALLLTPVFIVWTKALWNNLVPRITGWREITFWEAAGLTALLAFLV